MTGASAGGRLTGAPVASTTAATGGEGAAGRACTSGGSEIIGAMLESHLQFGSQSLPPEPTNLQYGVSITDACMDWEMTEKLLRD